VLGDFIVSERIPDASAEPRVTSDVHQSINSRASLAGALGCGDVIAIGAIVPVALAT